MVLIENAVVKRKCYFSSNQFQWVDYPSTAKNKTKIGKGENAGTGKSNQG